MAGAISSNKEGNRNGQEGRSQAPGRKVVRQKIRGEDGTWRTVTVNPAENPLRWLARRKDVEGRAWVSPEQMAAAERLRRDYTIAGMTPSVTSRWDFSMPVSGRRSGGRQAIGPADLQDAAIAARQRVHEALQAMGPELANLLLEVCCLSNGLEAAERRFGWPARSGKVVLQIALSQLGRYYGYINEADDDDRRAMRSWGAEGYRPSL